MIISLIQPHAPCLLYKVMRLEAAREKEKSEMQTKLVRAVSVCLETIFKNFFDHHIESELCTGLEITRGRNSASF